MKTKKALDTESDYVIMKGKRPHKTFDKDHLVMPPVAFSNAMNDINPKFDYTDWPNSKEWKLFNAGREQAAYAIHTQAEYLFKEAQELRQQGGLPKGSR